MIKVFTFILLATISLVECNHKCMFVQSLPDTPPYFYEHNIPDYTSGAEIQYPPHRDRMEDLLNQYIELLETNAPPEFTVSDMEDIWNKWVYTGSGGRAYIYLRLYQNNKNINIQKAQKYINLAEQHIQYALKNLAEDYIHLAFLKGNAGIYTVATVIYDILGQKDKAEYYLNLVLSYYNEKLDSKKASFGVQGGISGLVFAGKYLNAYFKEEKVPKEYFYKIGKILIDVGKQYAFENGTLRWPIQDPLTDWYLETNVMGFSHGSVGIIWTLMNIPEIINDPESQRYIKLTIDYYINRQIENGQIIHTENMKDVELKVQWCHGSPGFIHVFAQAGSIFNDMKYTVAAQKAAWHTFQEGILKKGMQFDHGTAGNSLILLSVYRMTQDLRYLYYGVKMMEFSLGLAEQVEFDKMIEFDCLPYSMFVDTIGSSIVAWSDMLSRPYDLVSMPSMDLLDFL